MFTRLRLDTLKPRLFWRLFFGYGGDMSDKQRAEFDKWLKRQDIHIKEDLDVWSAFVGWQAAMTSVKERMPEDNGHYGCASILHQVGELLD